MKSEAEAAHWERKAVSYVKILKYAMKAYNNMSKALIFKPHKEVRVKQHNEGWTIRY
jgi:hypothetical protein